MNDLIERQAVIDIALQYCPDDDGVCSKAGHDPREMLDEIEALPPAQPAALDTLIKALEQEHNKLLELQKAQPEQRTGKWIPSDSQCGIRCSVCGAPVDDFCHSIDYIDLVYEPNFCPNCGAKMTEGDAE